MYKWFSNHLVTILLILFLIPLYLVLYKIYIPRINAFGCFDDCNNFMGGYYLLQNKMMFTDFFFNHQPFMAYISVGIQYITHPENIFELILKHRQFVLLFSFISNAILIVRFKYPAVLFVITFELSKFYLFGDRFLAEGLIIYPLVYLVGLVITKFSKNNLTTIDYILAPVFAWFVIYMREPFIPLTLVLFATILFEEKIKLAKLWSFVIFTVLSLVTLISFNIPEYFFNVVTVNYQAVLPSDIKADMFGNRFFQALFYPIYIFFYGKWNILHQLLAIISTVFIINLVVLIKNKQSLLVGIIVIILGLSNIRVVIPGSMFYEAFHMLVWFGLFIYITGFLVVSNYKNKAIFYTSILLLALGFITFVSSKSYFPKENYNQHAQLLENYGEIMQQGNVISALSNPGDTLFLDASDDLIYWQAKLPSPYKYSWYTSAMPMFKKYTDERLQMFHKNPPVFYKEYGSCPKKGDIGANYRLPDFVQKEYIRLHNMDKPSCLFVRSDKISMITKAQWDKALESLYHLP